MLNVLTLTAVAGTPLPKTAAALAGADTLLGIPVSTPRSEVVLPEGASWNTSDERHKFYAGKVKGEYATAGTVWDEHGLHVVELDIGPVRDEPADFAGFWKSKPLFAIEGSDDVFISGDGWSLVWVVDPTAWNWLPSLVAVEEVDRRVKRFEDDLALEGDEVIGSLWCAAEFKQHSICFRLGALKRRAEFNYTKRPLEQVVDRLLAPPEPPSPADIRASIADHERLAAAATERGHHATAAAHWFLAADLAEDPPASVEVVMPDAAATAASRRARGQNALAMAAAPLFPRVDESSEAGRNAVRSAVVTGALDDRPFFRSARLRPYVGGGTDLQIETGPVVDEMREEATKRIDHIRISSSKVVDNPELEEQLLRLQALQGESARLGGKADALFGAPISQAGSQNYGGALSDMSWNAQTKQWEYTHVASTERFSNTVGQRRQNRLAGLSALDERWEVDAEIKAILANLPEEQVSVSTSREHEVPVTHYRWHGAVKRPVVLTLGDNAENLTQQLITYNHPAFRGDVRSAYRSLPPINDRVPHSVALELADGVLADTLWNEVAPTWDRELQRRLHAAIDGATGEAAIEAAWLAWYLAADLGSFDIELPAARPAMEWHGTMQSEVPPNRFGKKVYTHGLGNSAQQVAEGVAHPVSNPIRLVALGTGALVASKTEQALVWRTGESTMIPMHATWGIHHVMWREGEQLTVQDVRGSGEPVVIDVPGLTAVDWCVDADVLVAGTSAGNVYRIDPNGEPLEDPSHLLDGAIDRVSCAHRGDILTAGSTKVHLSRAQVAGTRFEARRGFGLPGGHYEGMSLDRLAASRTIGATCENLPGRTISANDKSANSVAIGKNSVAMSSDCRYVLYEWNDQLTIFDLEQPETRGRLPLDQLHDLVDAGPGGDLVTASASEVVFYEHVHPEPIEGR